MTKWQYLTKRVLPTEIISQQDLKDLGDKGWELCFSEKYGASKVYFFKRPIDEKSNTIYTINSEGKQIAIGEL